MKVPIIGKDGAAPKIATADSACHINIAFLDDHSFEGARFDIQNVTPEQIGAAILNLQHVAMMLIANRNQAIAAAMQQEQAIRRELEKGN